MVTRFLVIPIPYPNVTDHSKSIYKKKEIILLGYPLTAIIWCYHLTLCVAHYNTTLTSRDRQNCTLSVEKYAVDILS